MTLDELLTTDRAVITVAETARLLEVDERTVSRAIKAGTLPSVRVGRVLRVPVRKLRPMLTDPYRHPDAQQINADIAALLAADKGYEPPPWVV